MRRRAPDNWSAACTGVSHNILSVLGAALLSAMSAWADEGDSVFSWYVLVIGAGVDRACVCAFQVAASRMTKQQMQRRMALMSLQRTSSRTE